LQVKAATRKTGVVRGDALPAPEPMAGALPGPGAATQAPRPVVVASSQRSDVRPEEPTERQLSAPLDPRFTFDSFVVGKSNEFAHAAARR
ncbi:DnaA/Hda family protein, partial [Acinetobacter baumannii]